MKFEWDDEKARRNKAKHGVSFELAEIFDFDNAMIFEDATEDYDEERSLGSASLATRSIRSSTLRVAETFESFPSAALPKRRSGAMSNTSKPATKSGANIRAKRASSPMKFAGGGSEMDRVRKAALIGKSEPSKVSLLNRAKAALDEMTIEEDAAITAAARTDPDAQPNLAARRGRPRSDHTKIAILLRLDPDVVESFKKSGSGWQTRMNAALREAANLD
ncbi:BrnA antitoxin family protein [Mesorhizobium sp. M0152]